MKNVVSLRLGGIHAFDGHLFGRANVFSEVHFRAAGVHDSQGEWREIPRSKTVFQLEVGS